MPKYNKLENYIDPVFKFLKTLSKGKVVTYKMVAEHCGVPNPRNVGWILRQNTDPDIIPCYKVIRSDGSLAKGYKFGGRKEQKNRLAVDGIKFNRLKIANFKIYNLK
jgi:methylated-DNA-protein-cysteine methyltransferase related protein